MISELKGKGGAGMERMTGGGSESAGPGNYRGARGLDPHVVADIRRMFGFDKPPLTRFLKMLRDYLRFDFGRSFFRDSRYGG